MDLKSNCTVSVLTDHVPINKPRLGIHSSLLPYSSSMYITIPKRKPIPSKLDEVRASSWLDSMKSSSPPRRKLSKDSNIEFSSDENSIAYCSWLRKYPSALRSFEQITNYAKGKRMALFLDYDGTLSPIVDDPNNAFMSRAMRNAVREVANHYPTAIISGRCRDKVYEFVGLTELYYAGSHGLDIMGPVTHSVPVDDDPNCIRSIDKEGKEVNLFQPANEFIPMIDENWATIANCVHDILKEYPHLQLTYRRKVLEIHPIINWDKGKAVEFLLESLGLSQCDDVLPIYIGDDRTDEDAFKILREQNRGYGILVSALPKKNPMPCLL